MTITKVVLVVPLGVDFLWNNSQSRHPEVKERGVYGSVCQQHTQTPKEKIRGVSKESVITGQDHKVI